jgi:hypothetical protein
MKILWSNGMMIGLAMVLGLLSLSANVFGRSVTLQDKVEAFNPSNPAQLMGYFEPGSVVEVGVLDPVSNMVRVTFTPPGGSPIVALCKSGAINAGETSQTAAGNSASDTPDATGQALARKINKESPPLFQALMGLQPTLWNLTPSDFALKQSRFGFEWVSSTSQEASRSDKDNLKFFEYTLHESIVRFKTGKLSEVMMLLYGRGDSYRRSDDHFHDSKEFLGFITGVEQMLNEWMGTQGHDIYVAPSAVDLKKKSWFRFPIRADLSWSFTREKEIEGRRFRPEFVKLEITPYDGKTDIAQLTKANFEKLRPKIAKQSELKDRVTRDPNGDVYLADVPMVDQGMKGYCVVATAERLLKYYGLDYDQNEIAKVANAGAHGTYDVEMLEAIKKVTGYNTLIVKELKRREIQDYLKEVSGYNAKAARKNKKQFDVYGLEYIDLGYFYSMMDPQILKEVRLSRLDEKNKFVKSVVSVVDKGAPVIWCVTLGWVKEKPELPQAKGGHMRMIIGYNTKTSEIIYSDSWGSAHVFKRMPLDDAYFITSGLFSVLPSL